MKLVKDIDNNQNSKKISDKEAEEAIRTILSWVVPPITVILVLKFFARQSNTTNKLLNPNK